MPAVITWLAVCIVLHHLTIYTASRVFSAVIFERMAYYGIPGTKLMLVSSLQIYFIFLRLINSPRWWSCAAFKFLIFLRPCRTSGLGPSVRYCGSIHRLRLYRPKSFTQWDIRYASYFRNKFTTRITGYKESAHIPSLIIPSAEIQQTLPILLHRNIRHYYFTAVSFYVSNYVINIKKLNSLKRCVRTTVINLQN